MDNDISNSLEGIAIIGMSGRFPGAKNVEEFWYNLQNGVESISFFSQEELESAGIPKEVVGNPQYVKANAVLENIDLFDATFFGLNPKEAQITDPQHRMLLECAWEALEQAGYNPETYKGSIGVYAGAGGFNSYFLNNLYPNSDLRESVGDYQMIIANDKDFLSTRISYKLNLTGPSFTVQTACSTSLVAVCMACQNLLSYECDMALAGGVSIRVPQKTGYFYQEGMILSPDGHCRAFDAKAKGTVGGNGAGIVLLKRLSDAIADGDYIHAVIKGSAINNDGSKKIGYTAPSVDGQAQVIAQALANAEVEPETVTYIEAHGTGTPLGDPIEIAALTQVFSAYTQNKGFCAISSLKTNMGHLDTAAGVSGLIKTVQALKHKMLPPSLHFDVPNPEIDFANSPFYVNTTPSEWKTDGTPLRAGVSSFGIGGTNAHVILEEAPFVLTATASGHSRPWQLLVISAKTSSALDTATANLVEHFQQHSELNLADVAYTLGVGRRAFDHRRILVCREEEDAANALSSLDRKRVFSNYQESQSRSVVFMFSGQGSQYVNMALELYQVEPKFREQIDQCCELLKPHLGLDLRHILYPSTEQAEEAAQQLEQTALAQPVLFAIEYALSQLWMSWGVHPMGTIGHSIGEYVAACLAGVFSLEDALFLVATRGQLMQQLPTGAMLAVPLPEQQVQSLLDVETFHGTSLQIAAINGPSQCVVSGVTEAVNALLSKLLEQGVECRRLHTNHAFHSQMMEPILEPFTLAVKKVNLKPPNIPYLSNVTGTWITADQATNPSYWAKHLRSCVRFADGLQQLLKQPDRILLEIGPGRTLSTLAKQHPDQADRQLVLCSLRHPKDEQSDVAFLLTTLGKLWLAGVQLDWSGFYTHERRHRIPLPTYPFERQRYWIEPQKQLDNGRESQVLLHKKPDIADWFYLPVWKQSVPPALLGQGKGDLQERKSCWLMFVDECGLGSQIVNRLEQDGQDVILVKVGSGFTRQSDRVYTLDPRQPNDYEALLNQLLAQDKIPKTIVHLWSVTQNSQTPSGLEWVDKVQDLGLYSLNFLAQALGKQNFTDELQLLVISNNVQAVTGVEDLCPEKATLLGPVKVIGQEYPNLSCRSIDVIVPESGTRSEQKLIDQLLHEAQAKSSDLVIAYRGLHRWVQTFEPVRLDKSSEAKPRLREGGVYLITGGFGGMGLVLAEHLAKTVRAKLILLGRSAFPAPDERVGWLATHGEHDDISRKIRKVQELEKLGGEVFVACADVANEQQMQAVIAKAEKRFGQINGIIHTAGVADYAGVIQRRTREMTDSVLAPKVRGTLVLDKLLEHVELDFLILFSSLSSILYKTKFGQVGYSAANEFLDAFSYYKTCKKGTFTVSINWDDWQEVGMSVEAIKQAAKKNYGILQARYLQNGLLPSEGIDVFMRVLENTFPQVAVSTEDLKIKVDLTNPLSAIAPKSLGKDNLSQTTHLRPELSNAYVPPRNETERKIADIWQKFLGIEQVGIQDDFFELGGDSLLAVQLLTKLRETFQRSLSPHTLLQATTIAALAELIKQTQSQPEISTQQPRESLPSVLVEIQRGCFQQPFFLVHPIGGHVYMYRDLARYLGSDQTVYGIQSPGVDGEIDSFIKIEDIATDYIKALRVLQPNGPYFLGGSSFGGMVAFEMAKQLNALGQKVALLAMIDTPGSGQTSVLDETAVIVYYLLSFGINLSLSLEDFRQLERDEQLLYYLDQMKTNKVMSPYFGLPEIRRQFDLFKVYNQAMRNYVPQIYPGRVIFFRANERDALNPQNPELGWLDLAALGIEVVEVPGNHVNMNTPPHVQVLAEKLRVYLDEARQTAGITTLSTTTSV